MNLNNKKSNFDRSVLVIGGAGYIGSHLVLDLCDKGYDVTVFDNLSSGFEVNIDPRADFIKGDILNDGDLASLFKKKYLAIFHFAALKAVGDSMLDPMSYSKVNIFGTINILNQMVANNINFLIFSSTAAVYGKPQYLPLDEKHPLEPINYYGFTKLEMERLLKWYSSLKGINFAALRYFNAAGYDLDGRIVGLEKEPANLLPVVMETAIGLRKSISIFGNNYSTPDGTGIRDYIHVLDLVSAHKASLDYLLRSKSNIYLNLATGKGYSVLDVIKVAQSVTQKEIIYNFVDKRDGDCDQVVAKSNIAKKILDWDPKLSDMKQIIESMWNVYSKKIDKV